MLKRRLIFLLSVLCCAHALAGQGPTWMTSPEGYRYSLAIEPVSSSSSSSKLATATLEIEGLSASGSRVATLALDEGLELESESLRPRASASSSKRGLELRLELRATKPGKLGIKSLVIEAAEGSIRLGPIPVIDGEKIKAENAVGRLRRWVAPPSALRYEAFELRLEGPSSGGSAASASSSFGFPAEVSAEASAPGSWTLIAFEGKNLSLPRLGGAEVQMIRIDELPAGLEKTRAIGRFSFRLEGPEGAVPAGSTLRLKLILEGRGNLPALILPEPQPRLGLSSLPRSAWKARRIDDYRAVGGSYEGSASLELDIVPPRSGALSLSFPSFAVLDPEKGLTFLSLPSFERRIGEAPTAKDEKNDTEGRRLALLLAAARGTARGASASGGSSSRGATAPRGPRASSEAAAAARALSSELGAGAVLLDPLPPFYFFSFPAAAVAIAGLALFIASKAKRRKGGVNAIFLCTALAICLALSVLSLVSIAERKQSYAVIWTDRLRSVPSAKAELSIPIPRGSTGRLRAIVGSSPKYARLVLADGVEGWALLDSLYLY